MATTIQFWFDFASPYAFIAAKRVQAIPAGGSTQFDWQPFLVGFALRAKTQGISSTQLVTEAEARYRKHDVHRACNRLGLPLRWPSRYPRGSMLAARIAFWARGSAWQVPFIDAVFEANFLKDRDIASEDCIRSILTDLAIEPESTIAAATDPKLKEAFRT
ncbi:MAG: DsbA family protein, partial [Pseudomonadota bacterium]